MIKTSASSYEPSSDFAEPYAVHVVVATTESADEVVVELLPQETQTRQDREERLAEQAQANKDVPFLEVAEALYPERDQGVNPFFQVLYNHLRDLGEQVSSDALQGLTVREVDLLEPGAQYDLSLNTLERSDGVTASFNYSTDLFDAPRIERMAGHWQALLPRRARLRGSAGAASLGGRRRRGGPMAAAG